jgi:hypothetical protein
MLLEAKKNLNEKMNSRERKVQKKDLATQNRQIENANLGGFYSHEVCLGEKRCLFRVANSVLSGGKVGTFT